MRCTTPAIGCSEDELLTAGFDEFIVATELSTLTWKTVERVRAEHGEEPPPAGYA